MLTVQERIQQLLWNQRFVLIPDGIEVPDNLKYLIFKDLTLQDRNNYIFSRQLEKEIARKSNVPTDDELLKDAKSSGFWTKQDDVILREGQKEIKRLEDEIKTTKVLMRKKSLQKDIDSIKNLLSDTEHKKHILHAQSAEYYAHEVAIHGLIRSVVFKPNNTLLWQTDEDFISFKRSYPELLNFIAQEVLSEGMLEQSVIRSIARSPDWRLVWTLQRENLVMLFNRPVGDLCLNHRLLIYWSRIYDSAFESTEPPQQDVIDNDDKFDSWLMNRHKDDKRSTPASNHQENMQSLDGEYVESCTCGTKEYNHGKGLGAQKNHDSTCMYGTFRKYTQQERDEMSKQIYDRNSGAVRAIQEKEQRTIEEKGMINETDLRNKNTRIALGMPENIVKS